MYSIMYEEVNMDSQLKKGLLDVCVLAELERQDSYGYQIIKDISHIIEISESNLNWGTGSKNIQCRVSSGWVKIYFVD